ncbi:fatty acyl-AMP ligase [Azohydromonas sp. G-1-1-14]|uniref:Fatty acyl-AMP ligase n=1 Tax=Azohydromonas caseinilytica TaxID=2728836 RepID=A0A848FI97_9BURK|nr:fatty acyl-AMP ligase [Azohydromonas caseinilytica]
MACSMAGDQPGRETYLSYAELDAAARRLGSELLERGLQGERAVLLLQPGLSYVIALFGCWYAGVTAVPVYAPRQNSSIERVRVIQENAQARVIISTAQGFVGLEDGLAASVQRLDIDALTPGSEAQWRMPDIGEDTLAVLQYTSGSTGQPKGVQLRHRHLVENCRIISAVLEATPEDVGVFWIPPYHDMGLIGGILHCIYGRFPVHLMAPAMFLQRPMRWLEAISRHRGTITAAPNFAYDLCVRRARPDQIAQFDLSSWRVAVNGAEPVRADTLRRFAETFAPARFDIRTFYPSFGMAETTLLVTGGSYTRRSHSMLADREGMATGRVIAVEQDGVELVSSGRRGPGVDIAIVDPVSLQRCEPGKVGEIWISGATVADGYWQRPDATQETFGGRLAGSDANWLRTGDLGVLHEDELIVTGRIKDLIIIRGSNHYPHDIEATALAAHPALRPNGAAAFALETADGEGLGLVLEMDRGTDAEDRAQARTAVLDAVSRDHQLQVAQLVFVKANSIPKTSSGKVQRGRTRERLLAGELIVLNEEEVAA